MQATENEKWLPLFDASDLKSLVGPVAVTLVSVSVAIMSNVIRDHPASSSTAENLHVAVKWISWGGLFLLALWQAWFAAARKSKFVDIWSIIAVKGTGSATALVIGYTIVLFCVELGHNYAGTDNVPSPGGTTVIAILGLIFAPLTYVGFRIATTTSRFARTAGVLVMTSAGLIISFMYIGNIPPEKQFGNVFGPVSGIWFVGLIAMFAAHAGAVGLAICGTWQKYQDFFFDTDSEAFVLDLTPVNMLKALLPIWFIFVQLGIWTGHFVVYGCEAELTAHANAGKGGVNLHFHCYALSSTSIIMLGIITAIGAIGVVVTVGYAYMHRDEMTEQEDKLYLSGKTPTFTSATRNSDDASYATVATGDDCDADDGAVVTTPLKQREPHFRV